jgi:hypothetical protein
MTDRREAGNQQPSEANANQGRTQEAAPLQAEPAATPGPAGPPGPTTERPTLIGITFLGLIALVCVVALIILSNRPEPPGTPAAADAQAAAAEQGGSAH